MRATIWSGVVSERVGRRTSDRTNGVTAAGPSVSTTTRPASSAAPTPSRPVGPPAAPDRVEHRSRAESLGPDHRLRQPHDVLRRVGVRTADDRQPLAVGVDGVQVEVAAVPARPCAWDRRRRSYRLEHRPRRPERQGHLDPPVHALGSDRVRPEQDVPPPRFDVPGRRLRPADRERRPRSAAVAAKPASIAEPGPGRVEDADVEHIADDAWQRFGLVVRVAHLDLAGRRPESRSARDASPERRRGQNRPGCCEYA